MCAKTALSEEQYLHSSFPDLDKEFRDGEFVERTLPNFLHGRTQGRLYKLFDAHQKATPVFACVETRMKIRPGLYRIPDVAVFQTMQDLVPDTPPLVAIEILSPDDRLMEVREKLEEYRAWGVSHVWLVDPHAKRFYTCNRGLKFRRSRFPS
jgi:Uma2 family endonuclease